MDALCRPERAHSLPGMYNGIITITPVVAHGQPGHMYNISHLRETASPGPVLVTLQH